MDIKFGMWKIRSLCRARSLMTDSKEMSKYKLELIGIKEVRWDTGGRGPAGDYTVFYRRGNENHQLGTGVLCTQENHISN
jgi:hypothetical protein